MNQKSELQQAGVKRWLLAIVMLMMIWIHEGRGQLREGDIRSVGNGTWEEARIWEQWNGAAWIPLLPGEYPGGKSLPEARVVIKHEVVIPLGEAIYVASVQSEQGENLQVDGELVIGKQQGEPSTRTIATEQGGFSIAGLYPNPLIGQQGGRAWMVLRVSEGQHYQPVRLWIADESGQVVRTISPIEELTAGEHKVPIELGDLPSGNYLLVAESAGERHSCQVVVVQ